MEVAPCMYKAVPAALLSPCEKLSPYGTLQKPLSWGPLAVPEMYVTSPILWCRWVYRNPFSIFDPKAVDLGKGSRNGTVNSPLSAIPTTYQPRLRYSHMATLSHLPNGSIAAQWQV